MLFYGHYDVQPVDPLDLWETPPFAPRIATLPDGRKIIVARGACDDKGQVMTFVEACRAFKAVTGALPLPITMMIEGEEECGSNHLFGFVKDNAAELKHDLALVCDTSMWDPKTPMVTTSLRGLVYEEVNVTCADRDLHSGLFGGAAQNPLRVLAKILAAMHDKNGRVTIPGFYDGVKDLPKDIKADLAKLKLTPKEFLGPVGLKVPAGEKNRMLIEQIATRPTAEINGIIGGYTGEGAKTVIPGKAMAKVSFRLVGEQNPKKIRKAFRDFVRRGCRPTARSSSAISPARPRSSCRSTIRRSPRRARRSPPSGARRRSRSARAARSRSSATSSACSAWTRSWSASRSTTTACIRRTRSTTSRASTRAREAGRGYWRRWRGRGGHADNCDILWNRDSDVLARSQSAARSCHLPGIRSTCGHR